MKFVSILLAAGKGTRYKEKKQDIVFHGKPIWEYAYDTLADVVGKENIVVVGKDIEGGQTRTESVAKGLLALPSDSDYVVIVEAARPMVLRNQIEELFNSGHPSVTFVRPLVNTVIYRDGTYIDRNQLYDLLTPQAFEYRLLLEAYMSGKYVDMTDDTRIMYDYHGIKPLMIQTGSNLFKITYPGDMDIIESIYQYQIKEGLRNE